MTLLVIAYCVTIASLLPGARAAARPLEVNDYLVMELSAHMEQGTGQFEGNLTAFSISSHYRVLAIQGDIAQVSTVGTVTDATGEWPFSFVVNFSLSDRGYRGEVEFEGDYTDPAVWFWIHVPPMAPVRILDDWFSVVATDAVLWIDGLPRNVIQLEASGLYHWTDGTTFFASHYWDTYFFDSGTGLFLKETYTETNEGSTGSYRYVLGVHATDGSYTLPIHTRVFALTFVGIPVLILAISYGGWLGFRAYRTTVILTVGGQRRLVRVRRITDPQDLDSLDFAAAGNFAMFLRILALRALGAGFHVTVAARGRPPRVLGMGVLDPEMGIGSVYTRHSRLSRRIARHLRMKRFFSEVPLGPAARLPETDALAVYELVDVRPVAYDDARIQPFQRTHLLAATSVAKDVLRTVDERWIERCVRNGDLGFVAVEGSRVVGISLAMITRDVARLHTLAVLPENRGQGLESALVAASLTSLTSRHVQSVRMEIPPGDTPLIGTLEQVGFTRRGQTLFYGDPVPTGGPPPGRPF